MNSKKVKLIACAALAVLVLFMIFTLVKNIKDKKAFEENMLLGSEYMKRLEYEKAFEAYKTAAEINNDEEAYRLAAAACEGFSDYENAIKYYKKSIKYDKNDINIKSYEGLAELYILQGENDEAAKLTEKAVKKSENSETAQLYERFHPKAPQPDYEQGEYSERIRVAFTAGEGEKIYITSDGTEPQEIDLYTAPVILKNGTTQIKVKAVNDRGYESETVSYTYTINIEDKVIEFDDKGIEAAVRKQLSVSDNEPVYNDDAAGITKLVLVSDTEMAVNAGFTDNSDYYAGEVKTLTDLKNLPFIEELNIIGIKNCDITSISLARSLKYLSLRYMDLEDVSALSGLVNLEKLCLADNNISNIFPVGNLTGLSSLGIWNNNISDISPLSGLVNLKYFDISKNDVKDISIIANMPELKELWLYDNNVRDISAILELKEIRIIMARNNPIIDLGIFEDIYPRLERCDIELDIAE